MPLLKNENCRKKFLNYIKKDLQYNNLYSIITLRSNGQTYRGVEQLVARRAHNPEVVGSSPSPATKNETLTFKVGVSFLVMEKILINRRPTGFRSEVARAPSG